MSAPIISAETASRLNGKVMERIDPRLYLFCNYEPTVRHAISEDAEYQIAIQDLYKFAIDSGCVIKNYSKYLKKGQVPKEEFKGLQEIINCISMLRTIFDHNTSDKNGRLEKDKIERYSVWIKSVLNKPNPEDISDYIILNRYLSDMALRLVDYIDMFVDRVSRNLRKNDIVQMWKDETLHWYCGSTKTDIYLGQLQDAYIANTIANGRDYSELYDAAHLKRKVFRWIEEALYYHLIGKEYTQVYQDIITYKKMLKGELAIYEAMKKRKTQEEIENENQRIHSLLAIKQNRFAELKKMQKEMEGKYIDYFFKRLEKQLKATVARLDADGISYTYLPQDLIQEDIVNFFDGIRSPENDF